MKRSFLVCLVCVALTFPALGNSARASEPVEITADPSARAAQRAGDEGRLRDREGSLHQRP